GNWISGIPIIDARVGPQKNMPASMKDHPARNRYFLLPLLLGLMGLFFQLDKNAKDFWVVMSLFILTGLAIVIYLNQTPYQPRERDYAYAGSFYAFSIWIGIGVAAIFRILQAKLKENLAATIAIGLSILAVPTIMAVENWDDHDRSGRYTARDIARNYMNSCEKDAILFTVGDNDTFPLWYVQDVEGVREDVRIVNMMLFNMDWYVDQMRLKNYSSEPLKFTLPESKYKNGTNNSIYVRENEGWAPIDYILTFVKSDDPRTKLPLRSGEKVDYIPTQKLILPVDSAKAISSGAIRAGDEGKMLPELRFTLKPNEQIMKGSLAQLDVLGSNNWDRPIYYTSGGFDGSLGLERYYQTEGLAYRLVPIETNYKSILEMGRIDTDTLYERLMNKFEWGRMNQKDVHLDYYTIRTFSVIRFRSLHTQLALQLMREGKKEKAVQVLDRCMELAPDRVLPYDQYISGITFPDRSGGVIHHEGVVEAYYLCGEPEKGNEILKEHYTALSQKYLYLNSMKKRHQASIQREINEVLYQMEELSILLQNFNQRELMLELGIS
ncbi:MAG: DUF2723 domain-containing protein, partial [Bacteroides sp.]|nr:DUF2723 domain-containing protein [Bacteroides sp.]